MYQAQNGTSFQSRQNTALQARGGDDDVTVTVELIPYIVQTRLIYRKSGHPYLASLDNLIRRWWREPGEEGIPLENLPPDHWHYASDWVLHDDDADPSDPIGGACYHASTAHEYTEAGHGVGEDGFWRTSALDRLMDEYTVQETPVYQMGENGNVHVVFFQRAYSAPFPGYVNERRFAIFTIDLRSYLATRPRTDWKYTLTLRFPGGVMEEGSYERNVYLRNTWTRRTEDETATDGSTTGAVNLYIGSPDGLNFAAISILEPVEGWIAGLEHTVEIDVSDVASVVDSGMLYLIIEVVLTEADGLLTYPFEETAFFTDSNPVATYWVPDTQDSEDGDAYAGYAIRSEFIDQISTNGGSVGFTLEITER